MIEEIRIDNLGVIGRAHLELGPGLTVITGETGAGKTMVLTALGLMLGGKADSATVRVGAASAAVEGRVTLAADSAALARATEAGAELDDDGSLVLVRTVGAGLGRTVPGVPRRAFGPAERARRARRCPRHRARAGGPGAPAVARPPARGARHVRRR